MSIQLGEHSYSSTVTVQAWTTPNVVIKTGKFCSLAGGINFVIDGNHNMNSFSTYPFKERFGWGHCPKNNWGKSIPTVGNDVWIGNNVTIYSGVNIGDGAVIAGQSVVTRDVPPYSLVAGNPGRVKKYRFSPEIITELQQLKWWDLPLETIKTDLIPHIDDIEAFLSKLRVLRG